MPPTTVGSMAEPNPDHVFAAQGIPARSIQLAAGFLALNPRALWLCRRGLEARVREMDDHDLERHSAKAG